jgi:hypothetical protein
MSHMFHSVENVPLSYLYRLKKPVLFTVYVKPLIIPVYGSGLPPAADELLDEWSCN